MRIVTLKILVALQVLAAVFIGIEAWRDLDRAAVDIEWETATELDVAGFNVYRSFSEGSERILLNQELISASDDALIGAKYQYNDPDVSPGNIYYYWLEEIGLNGGTLFHGPIEIQAKSDALVEFGIAITLVSSVLVLYCLSRKGTRLQV